MVLVVVLMLMDLTVAEVGVTVLEGMDELHLCRWSVAQLSQVD